MKIADIALNNNITLVFRRYEESCVSLISTNCLILLLCSSITQKLCKSFCFFSFTPSRRHLWTDWHKFFHNKLLFVIKSVCGQNQTNQYKIPYAFMPCALEINSKGQFKQGHMESRHSTVKNIYPLPQYL